MINPIICLFIFILTISSPTETQAQDPDYFSPDPQFQFSFCNPSPVSNQTYTSGSSYASDLTQILDTLVSYSSSNRFYSFTQGSGTDQIWTLFYCRYDFTLPECKACVQAAVNKVPALCNVEKEAVIYYEQCTLHYANRDIFALEEENLGFAWQGSKYNVPMEVEEFNSIMLDNLDLLINQTVSNSSKEMMYFGTMVTNLSSANEFYALAQCTPDITAGECDRCLRGCVSNIPEKGRVLMRVFHPSCQITYALSLFFRVDNGSVALSPTSLSSAKQGKSAMFYITTAVIPAVTGILILLAVCFCLTKRGRLTRNALIKKKNRDLIDVETGAGSSDYFQFDLDMLKDATGGFSTSNKLGEGGFGIVYRGVLENGQQVAIKRLSKNSGQGAQEFKTEVDVVAKLQHKNLVRLVGYCVEEEEQILVYEFLPNLSLERFLYDPKRSAILTWEIRSKIMTGIASGLHYLHEDSRVKIVHRDLKISNILLDDDLGPKIADFGLARLVNVNQTSANTARVVGTYGYMAPEYALAGRFSTKSDVYSYGVMILEILSGKSNNKFYETTHGEGLLRNAWRVWSEGGVEQFIDSSLEKMYPKDEARRFIQIGLLCVQDDDLSRPTMHAVLVMFNHTAELPAPLFPSLVSKNMPDFDDGDSKITAIENQQSDQFTESSNTFYLRNNLHAR